MSSSTEGSVREIKLETLAKRELPQELEKEPIKTKAPETPEKNQVPKARATKLRVRKQTNETPEQAIARRALAAEKERKRIAIKRAAKKAEQEQILRLQIANDPSKEIDVKPQIQRKSREDLLKHKRESAKRKRHQIAATETPEEKEARLAMLREQNRAFRARQRAQETPEQFAARRAPAAKRQNQRQQAKRAIMYATETPEQKATRLQISREKRKKHREKMLATETPEQAAARHAKTAEWQRRRMERDKEIKANETPEERVIRLEYLREKTRKSRAKRIAMGTSNYTTERQFKKANEISENSDKFKMFNQEATDGNFNSSCTWSSFGTSDADYSITTTDGSFSITTTEEYLSAQHNTGEIVVKNEISQDSWSDFDESQPSQSEDLNCKLFSSKKERDKIITDRDVKSILPCAQTSSSSLSNDYLVYGEYIADRFFKCNRSDTEINYAKSLIESIMSNLMTGAYRNLIPDKPIGIVKNEKVETVPSFAFVEPSIIVKEEVDL